MEHKELTIDVAGKPGGTLPMPPNPSHLVSSPARIVHSLRAGEERVVLRDYLPNDEYHWGGSPTLEPDGKLVRVVEG